MTGVQTCALPICYKGGSGRTRMKVLHLARRDYIALTAVAVLVALLVLERVFL